MRLYVSDRSLLFGLTDWRPRLGAPRVLEDTFTIRDNERDVAAALL